MTFTSIGDLSRQFTSMHQIAATRSRLDTLATELSSGRVADPAARLSGRTDLLADVERRITLLRAGLDSTTSLLRRFETTHIALDQIDAQRALVSRDLLALPPGLTRQMIDDAAARAEGAFATIVSALGARHGAESLFAGTATDRAAMAGAETILAALRADVAGATDSADLIARLDTFFDDPGGSFATVAYTGDTGAPLARRINGRDIVLTIRADDPALRNILKGLALAMIAADTPADITDAERGALLHQAGAALVTSAGPLSGLRATLGRIEEHAELSISQQSAALTAASIRQRDMVSANPKETAVALRETQSQLETQYAVTARLAELSLTGYLR